jgi:uncharacterized protein YbjQ (UPF0145 family)
MADRSSGTWGSALTADEFASIRGVGFEPVAQVFGAAVYDAGSAGAASCPGPLGTPAEVGPAGLVSPVPGRDGLGLFGGLVRAMNQARHTAIDRMAAECAAAGGHGVAGVRLTMGSFALGGLEFRAIGTAVRAPGAAYQPRVPFTCGVSGQDFAKLIMTGWVPAGLVLGISIRSRHDDRTTARQARWRSGNAEVTGWTELVSQSRQDARRHLESDVIRLGAEGVVISTMQMRVRERDCPEQAGRRDHIVEAALTGTAIVRFSPTGQDHTGQGHTGPALAIMSLDPQRRQAARTQLPSLAGCIMLT